MQMALNADKWLQLNTSYCHRLGAWISAKSCEANRLHSEYVRGALRCRGCNGLQDQPNPLEVTLTHTLHLAMEEVLDTDISPKEQSSESGAEIEDGLDCLDHGLIDEDELDRELAALLPESEVYLQSPEAATGRKARSLKTHKIKKFAVYMGRCQRCGGYMINSPERQFDEKDEAVFRCLSCSWRTSPGYELNRGNM